MVIMKQMVELAREYSRTHDGLYSKLTDYSFEFTPYPKKKDEQPKSYVVMLSYFWEKEK